MKVRNILAFALGPIGGGLLSLITLPVIAWFFSQENVGKIAMLQVAIGFATLFFSFGLDQAYVREFHEVEDRPALFKRAVVPGVIGITISLIVLLVVGDLSGWLFDESKFLLSLLVALAIFTSFLSRFLSLILRMEERGLAFSMSQLLPKLFLLMIIGSYVLTGANRDLENLVWANAAAIALVFFVFLFNTRKEWLAGLKSSFDYQSLKRSLKFGLPLIGSGIAFWGLSSVDKIILKDLSSYNELAIYSVALSFASAATVLKVIFSTIWSPMVYKWATELKNLDKIERVVKYILLLIVLVFSFIGLLSGLVVYLLPNDYAEVQWIIVACMGFPLFYLLSESTVVGIGVTKRTLFALIAPVIALVINVVGNYLLIPEFGAAGAATSTCVAFFIFFVVRTEISGFLWRPNNRSYLYWYTTVCLFGAVSTALYGEALDYLVTIFWSSVLVSLPIFFKHEIFEIYSWVQSIFKNKDLMTSK